MQLDSKKFVCSEFLTNMSSGSLNERARYGLILDKVISVCFFHLELRLYISLMT